MKRDKEWLKKGIEVVLYRANLRGTLPAAEGNLIYDDIVSQIDQLDEPEVKQIKELDSYNDELIRDNNQLRNALDNQKVLSQEWINEHKKSYTMEDSVEISDLQNLIVPKQEELESKIKVLIESYKQEEDAYSNPENGWISGFIDDLKNLVEKEQKYHVTDENDTLLCKFNGVVMTVGKLWAIGNEYEAEYDLTEQEIKDYDERFWTFAVPVEELEE